MSELAEKTGLITITKFALNEIVVEDFIWEGISALTHCLASAFFFFPL